MQGTIYYYYDKVLVANCKLRTLEPYVGKIAKRSAVQLLVYSLQTENVHLPMSAGILSDGDFCLVALSENIIYQIHKNGTLIRAYTAGISQVEETIMDVPMAVLAMLQGKLLLRGTVISIRNDTYAVFGEAEMLKCGGLSDGDTILLTEDMEGYKGILCFRFGSNGDLYGQQATPKLTGILVLQHIGQDPGVTLITETEMKKQLLLEHLAGYSMFSKEQREDISNSRFLRDAGQKIPMASLCLSKGCKIQDEIDSYDFSVFEKE